MVEENISTPNVEINNNDCIPSNESSKVSSVSGTPQKSKENEPREASDIKTFLEKFLGAKFVTQTEYNDPEYIQYWQYGR